MRETSSVAVRGLFSDPIIMSYEGFECESLLRDIDRSLGDGRLLFNARVSGYDEVGKFMIKSLISLLEVWKGLFHKQGDQVAVWACSYFQAQAEEIIGDKVVANEYREAVLSELADIYGRDVIPDDEETRIVYLSTWLEYWDDFEIYVENGESFEIWQTHLRAARELRLHDYLKHLHRFIQVVSELPEDHPDYGWDLVRFITDEVSCYNLAYQFGANSLYSKTVALMMKFQEKLSPPPKS